MRVLYERCAAVDVGKDVIAVAVRLPGDGPDGRQTVKRAFKTFYGVLAEAARWLVSLGVTHVAMEATGIYSMPVYHALIEHGDFEKVLVCNAGHVKNVPGRKTDFSDAEWLVHLLECGLLAGSFIPPADVKAARDVLRYRTKVAQQRVSEIARLGNVLQDTGIKLDSVASSIAAKSGRAMIEALIDGERRGPVLADLAKGKMRAKIPDLAMALEGRFGDHHALMCRLHLDHIDHLEAMLARLDAQIEAMMTPFQPQRDLLTTVPGIGPLSAAAVISEIGADVREYFPVGCQKSACSVSCSDGPASAYDIMIIRVSPPALSHLRPALRLAGPDRPVIGLQGRRAARAAARGRRAAPRPAAAPARLGRPRDPRCADPVPASTVADTPAGYPRHRPAVAPPLGRPQMDLSSPDGPTAGQRRDRRADRAARHREPRLGIQEDPR